MTLNSAGVEVTVIDESFYTAAAPGSAPLIFITSRGNKNSASGTGLASGTLASNAGKVWTITSQRDLTDTFGTPLFYKDSSGNPVHGGELNEYGLQAAYSFLGVSSRAYVVRANIDLKQLEPSATIPSGSPISGTHWIDTISSKFGVSEWNLTSRSFVSKTPLIINDDNVAFYASANKPVASFGNPGQYCLYATKDNDIALWYKNHDNVWVKVGTTVQASFGSPIVDPTFTSTAWSTSWPVASGVLGTLAANSTVFFNGRAVTFPSITLDDVCRQINQNLAAYGIGAKNNNGRLSIYCDSRAASNSITPDGKLTISVAPGYPNAPAQLGIPAGSYGPVNYVIAPHFQFPSFDTDNVASGSVYVRTTTPNNGANWSIKAYNATSQVWQALPAPLYALPEHATNAIDPTGGGRNIVAGSMFVQYNTDEGSLPGTADFKVYRRHTTSPTVTSVTVSSGFAFTVGSQFSVAESVVGSSSLSSTKVVTITTSSVAGFASAISAAGFTNVSASYDPVNNIVSLSHDLGGEIYLLDGLNSPLSEMGLYNSGLSTYAPNVYPTGASNSFALRVSNWKPIELLSNTIAFSGNEPTTKPANGTLWYSSIIDEVDIMVHNGTTWVGYKNAYPNTSPAGPIIKATMPDKDTGQSDGTPLVEGDIWIDSSDSEMYGMNVYVWSANLLKWIKQDLADSTSPNGWLFADARWADAGTKLTPSTIGALLTSNYLDPDAPNPALYPKGVRLWNTRRSGNNVKMYKIDAIDIKANNGLNTRFSNQVMDGSSGVAKYETDRWVSVVGNRPDGSGMFGRHSQRGYIVQTLKSIIDTNLSVRDTDTLTFNMIVCPGYPEVIQNMINLNTARGLTAFVIGDSPMRLAANGTALREWGSSTTALDNGDAGAVSYDEYTGIYYPSGYTTDNSGSPIVVPPSHMILRTYALSDQKSYPWFAPAGTRRGGVDNATAVGYLLNGEFQQAAIPQSIRDVLQDVKVNPISTIPGAGLVVFGQKTRARNASSLDRVNVARLVAYLRRQLDILARPFLFEPNDRITRNEIKQSAESFLLELVGLRAIYDFIVVCDETNNTPARIDRNELYVDIAIEPVKAIEFIYIPLRLKNTGDIAAGR